MFDKNVFEQKFNEIINQNSKIDDKFKNLFEYYENIVKDEEPTNEEKDLVENEIISFMEKNLPPFEALKEMPKKDVDTSITKTSFETRTTMDKMLKKAGKELRFSEELKQIHATYILQGASVYMRENNAKTFDEKLQYLEDYYEKVSEFSKTLDIKFTTAAILYDDRNAAANDVNRYAKEHASSFINQLMKEQVEEFKKTKEAVTKERVQEVVDNIHDCYSSINAKVGENSYKECLEETFSFANQQAVKSINSSSKGMYGALRKKDEVNELDSKSIEIIKYCQEEYNKKILYDDKQDISKSEAFKNAYEDALKALTDNLSRKLSNDVRENGNYFNNVKEVLDHFVGEERDKKTNEFADKVIDDLANHLLIKLDNNNQEMNIGSIVDTAFTLHNSQVNKLYDTVCKESLGDKSKKLLLEKSNKVILATFEKKCQELLNSKHKNFNALYKYHLYNKLLCNNCIPDATRYTKWKDMSEKLCDAMESVRLLNQPTYNNDDQNLVNEQVAIDEIRSELGRKEDINAPKVEYLSKQLLPGGESGVKVDGLRKRQKFDKWMDYYKNCKELAQGNKEVLREIGHKVIEKVEKLRVHNILLSTRGLEELYVKQQKMLDSIREDMEEPPLNKASKVEEKLKKEAEKSKPTEAENKSEAEGVEVNAQQSNVYRKTKVVSEVEIDGNRKFEKTEAKDLNAQKTRQNGDRTSQK